MEVGGPLKRLTLSDRTLETHPGNRVLRAIRAVGAIPGGGTDDSTANAINGYFGVVSRQSKLFPKLGDKHLVLAAFLVRREDVPDQIL